MTGSFFLILRSQSLSIRADEGERGRRFFSLPLRRSMEIEEYQREYENKSCVCEEGEKKGETRWAGMRITGPFGTRE